MTRLRFVRRSPWWLALPALLVLSAPARAQLAPRPVRPTGRISFYTNVSQTSPASSASVTRGDFMTNVSYSMPDGEGGGLEYAIDFRHAGYTDSRQTARMSMYDGYVGVRFADGHARVRVGQMWLNDLGGLGSVTGVAFEYKQGLNKSQLGRLRLDAFAGMEPKPYNLGFVANIHKFGGYGILEGGGGRRHVIGYVHMSNGGLTERSVLSATNFVPWHSRVFVYQALEYDLVGPAGQGKGGLSYLMLNGHARLTERLDVQGLYHRGRSIDARAITDDILAGRPLRDGALSGLLYSSAGGRVSMRLTKDLRVNGGFSRDQNNRDSSATHRVNAGVSAGNIAGSGVDVTGTVSLTKRPTGNYNSFWVSAGRQFGRALYLSGDFSTSASVVRFTRSDGITIETRPETKQFGVSGVITASRHVSFTFTTESTHDKDVSEVRVLTGMTYRIR